MNKSNTTDQHLDAEEQELFDSFERGEWKKSKNAKAETVFARRAAKNFFIKNRRINIRLAHSDLHRIKRRAATEGMPYQTLIGSILHKYAAGHL